MRGTRLFCLWLAQSFFLSAALAPLAAQTLQTRGYQNTIFGKENSLWHPTNDENPGCGNDAVCEDLCVFVPINATLVDVTPQVGPSTSNYQYCQKHPEMPNGGFYDCANTPYFRFYPGTYHRYRHDAYPVDKVCVQARNWSSDLRWVNLTVTFKVPPLPSDGSADMYRGGVRPTGYQAITDPKARVTAELENATRTTTYHWVNDGDTLGSISKLFYGSPTYWLYLYRFNSFLGSIDLPKNKASPSAVLHRGWLVAVPMKRIVLADPKGLKWK
jgi:hypothetical protein